MSRPSHRPEAAEVLEVLALIPTTRRKALRIARIRQDGVEMVEIRSANIDPDWQPSVGDHRTVIRTSAIGRMIAALEAAETQAAKPETLGGANG